MFGPTCTSCKSNDNPCTVNNKNSNSKDVSNKGWRHRGNNASQCIEHSINKQIHFKHRDKDKAQILSEKKLTILREPILKSIGRSIYHNGNKSKSCCESKLNIEHKVSKSDQSDATNQTWFGLKACNELKNGCTITKSEVELSKTKSECEQGTGTATDANNVMIHRIQNWQLNDDSTVDFKSLVNECDNLTLSTRGLTTNSITELHKTKNFQILQASQIGSTNAVASTSGTDTNPLNNSSNALLSSAANNAMNSSLSSNSSNSSSCSQQARMNSSNCDVTIDELASYIEFQLHLPKPMSSNVYEAMFS